MKYSCNVSCVNFMQNNKLYFSSIKFFSYVGDSISSCSKTNNLGW